MCVYVQAKWIFFFFSTVATITSTSQMKRVHPKAWINLDLIGKNAKKEIRFTVRTSTIEKESEKKKHIPKPDVKF